MKNKKKISFSGIQPSGVLHIGNYLGAIKQWVKMQDEVDESIYCIVDLHAITVSQDSKELKENILKTAALYIACGIDPEKSSIFVQSSRPEHTEMTWLLNCNTNIGELKRMTQYKEKSFLDNQVKNIRINLVHQGVISRHSDKKKYFTMPADERFNDFLEKLVIGLERKGSVGLFDYPVLMASDILLYQTTEVPVGIDQKQHVELARDIAQRVNNRYDEEIFTLPEPIMKKGSAKIMSLDNPKKKMSKSDESDVGYIAMTDSPDDIRRKIKRAVTDSGSEIKSGGDKPALTNLLNIYSEFSGKSVQDIESDFKGKGYGEFKEALADVIVEGLKPIQERYKELMADKESLILILNKGSEKIAPVAQKTLKDLKNKIGLGI